LEAVRRDDRFQAIKRPIIFVAHSLGGIIVKEALRQSRGLRDYRENQAQIFESTFGIIFFGTPHRGASLAEWGEIARRLAAAFGFDTNKQLLKGSQPDSERLEEIREEFSKMLYEKNWKIHSFQESVGILSIPGLREKVSLMNAKMTFTLGTDVYFRSCLTGPLHLMMLYMRQKPPYRAII
jgi:hypothetical protein